jgi:acetylornithine deacetylase/succinyl-diaminopimelate desuccinylase-like protein
MSADLASRLIHSADERVPVDDLELGVEFLRFVAQSLGRFS